MNRQIRRKKNMAVRVRAFSHAHPSADPSFVSVLGRLEEDITLMERLESQQTGGFLSKHSATVQRQDLRRRVRDGLLRHLVTVAQDAAVEDPALIAMFTLPGHNLTTGAFQSLSRKLLDQGVAQKELLMKHGLSDKLLDDLKAAVDAFDASVVQSNEGLNDHVLAGAEFRRIADDIMRVVGMMDAINRYRFQNESALLAAWKAAKHVVTGPQTEEEKAAGAVPPATGPVQPGLDAVKPAA